MSQEQIMPWRNVSANLFGIMLTDRNKLCIIKTKRYPIFIY